MMHLNAIEPFYHDRPWSRHLAGKSVIVMSPFAETIEAQYKRRQQVQSIRQARFADARRYIVQTLERGSDYAQIL